MTACVIIFTILKIFPKTEKSFTILKILLSAAKRALPRGGCRVEYHNIIRIQKLKREAAFRVKGYDNISPNRAYARLGNALVE